MTARRAALTLLAAGAVGLVLLGMRAAGGGPTIRVPESTSVAEALAGVPPGATVQLLAGTHESFSVAAPVRVVGGPGVIVRGPVTVRADGVTLESLTIVGGENGVTVERAQDVRLKGLVIRGAELHGIEVVSGAVTVEGCVIEGLRSPYGQGFEIRNANGLPRTVVRGCRIASGQEGLVSHVSRVEFRDNLVSGTSLRAIAVTEMSEGLVEGNLVRDALGIGLYCGDESHCEIRENRVAGVADDGSGVRSRAGYGAVAWYGSMMRLVGNEFTEVDAGPVGLFQDSSLTGRFPLGVWPAGWGGAVPALWVSAAALAGIGLVRAAAGPILRRRPGRGTGAIPKGALAVLAGGFAVQTFHMLEHGVQVFQVHVAEAEIRSGLVGAHVDTEWVHFLFNAAVIAFLVWAWRLIGAGAGLPVGASGASWLAAAVLVQAYHVAEHTAKLVQHLATGVDPAPGILGGAAGLVWFHFGINLAVYAAMAIPIGSVLARSLGARGATPRLVAANLP